MGRGITHELLMDGQAVGSCAQPPHGCQWEVPCVLKSCASLSLGGGVIFSSPEVSELLTERWQ